MAQTLFNQEDRYVVISSRSFFLSFRRNYRVEIFQSTVTRRIYT